MLGVYATEQNVQLPPSDLLNSYTPANGLNDAFRCPSATFDGGGWYYSAPVRIFAATQQRRRPSPLPD